MQRLPLCIQQDIEYINEFDQDVSSNNIDYCEITNLDSAEHFIIGQKKFFLYTGLMDYEYNKPDNLIHCSKCNKKNKEIVKILAKQYEETLQFSPFTIISIKSTKYCEEDKERINRMNIYAQSKPEKNTSTEYNPQDNIKLYIYKYNKDDNFFSNMDRNMNNIIAHKACDAYSHKDKYENLIYKSFQNIFYSYMIKNQLHRNNIYNESEICTISELMNLKHIYDNLKYIDDSLDYMVENYTGIRKLNNFMKKKINIFDSTANKEGSTTRRLYESLFDISNSNLYQKHCTIPKLKISIHELKKASVNMMKYIYSKYMSIIKNNKSITEKYKNEYKEDKNNNSYIYNACTIERKNKKKYEIKEFICQIFSFLYDVVTMVILSVIFIPGCLINYFLETLYCIFNLSCEMFINALNMITMLVQ